MKGELSLKERLARGAIICEDGLTEQSHKDSCDINKVMANYAKTGLVPVHADQVPQHGDFSCVVDYQDALNLVIAAQESFDSLPAVIRKEFDHDPGLFLSALDDPTARERLVNLGVFVERGASSGASVPPPEDSLGA